MQGRTMAEELRCSEVSSRDDRATLEGLVADKRYPQITEEVLTIAQERARASFRSEDMSKFLLGEEFLEMQDIALQLMERDPLLYRPTHVYYDETTAEQRKFVMQMIKRLQEIRAELISKQQSGGDAMDERSAKIFENLRWMLGRHDRAFQMRVYVHVYLFDETIREQGTAEQYARWAHRISTMQEIGCFAMTELGHSSFLRGLETTATYDRKSEQFVIHSPTVTSTKWWIGMAGKTATATVALCQLMIDGKNHGVQWFIVPLRSRETGQLLPGVTCGDIGAKQGRRGLDNGWIQFTQVRIPRENMLMRWARVDADGTFTPPENIAISYATLISERLAVGMSVYDTVGQAVTTAVRYGAVRRQGEKDQQVMDYQSHYGRLMPVVAGVYASLVLYKRLKEQWSAVQAGGKDAILRHMQENHAITAGLKAWLGWWGQEAVETCRRTMGGHGFSAYNAIAGLQADYAVTTQGGGDNVVLAQQTARFLCSCVKRGLQGKTLAPSVQHLADMAKTLGESALPASASLRDLSTMVRVLEWLSCKTAQVATSGLAQRMGEGMTGPQAWNETMSSLLDASRCFFFFFAARTLLDSVREASAAAAPEIHAALERCAALFAAKAIEADLSLLLEFGFLSGTQARAVRDLAMALCKDMRPDAVPLVDAFAIPDSVLKAPLGRYDGNVYNAYLETVKASKDDIGRPPYWQEHIAPLTQSKL